MGSNHFDTNKRIAMNTLFLYGRMLVMMLVSLFTFRELLELLGINSYGTYNAIGGIVILFSFLSHALTQSNQRFLSYHIGRNEQDLLSRTFSMMINVQLIIGGIILIVAETIGLWFLNFKMNFEGESMTEVNMVYQFTILTFIIQLIQIPYTSAIISHERMKLFSYASIGDALLRLGAVMSLTFFDSNRLVLYSLILSVNALLVLAFYYQYCRNSFSECRYSQIWEKPLFYKLLNLSTWNMVGGLGTVGASQGINILFNIFGGVALNAALGVSNQVHTAVNSLVGNMQTAFNPQIIKSYAKGDSVFFNSLIFRASRFSFYLITIVGVPSIFCMKDILFLWLTDVPEYSIIFTQLIIIYCMAESLSGPLWIANQAYGKVRNYMVTVAFITLSTVPIGYVLLKQGFSPIFVVALRILMSLGLLIFRIIYLKVTINFPIRKYLYFVGLKVLFLVICIIPVYVLINYKFHFEGLANILFSGGILFLITLTLGFYILLNKNERGLIENKIKSIYGRRG